MSEPFDKTDEVIAKKLAEIAPPADLRARLLAIDAGAVVEAPVAGWWARGVTAVAALLVVTLTILSLWPRGQTASQPIADAKSEMATFLSSGFSLALKTSDVDQVREWLAAKHSKLPMTLPNALARNSAIGCRDLMWRGHAGALACFRMKDGGAAHLAMFPEQTFSDAPGAQPQMASAGSWTSAAWSSGGMTYILFVPAGMDPMQQLTAWSKDQRLGKIASSNFRSTAWPVAKTSSGVPRMVSAGWI